MGKDLISKRTRIKFREFFVGWTLREIHDEFDSAGLRCDVDYSPPTSGQRRSLVEQYYHAIDFSSWADVQKLLVVYGGVLTSLETLLETGTTYDPKAAQAELVTLKKELSRDGYLWKDQKLYPENRPLDLPDSAGLGRHIDAPELHRQIDRIRDSVDEDPGLAVGTAKELVETTCKTILEDLGVTLRGNEELVQLVKLTRKELDLLPSSIPDSAKGVEVIRRLLSNLGTIAQSLGELRNLYGTGHGRTGRRGGLKPRHARLAVGAASTLAMFLFETHQEQETSGKE